MNKASAILVVEPVHTGHRMAYVRWIAEGVLRAGREVAIATVPPALGNPLLRSLGVSYGDRVKLIVADEGPRTRRLPGAAGLLAQQWAHYSWCATQYRTACAEHAVAGVVLPYADACLFAIAAAGSPFGGTPWVGVTMRATFGADGAKISWLKSTVLRRASHAATCRGLYCISPSLHAHGPRAEALGLRYLADPAELRGDLDRRGARARLGITSDTFVVLVFGAINGRKGVAELLAGRELLADPGRLTVLIAGRQLPDVRALLATSTADAARREGSIILVDRFLDDADVADTFAAADAVWLGYVGHEGMSGVAVLAGRAGRPIIACSNGEVGALATTLGIGPVAEVREPRSVRAALEEVMQPARLATYAARSAAAFADHTPENFATTLLEPLLTHRVAA
jgi:glycosyltransferase involved in cell wall biosynthesis